jgi:hypothetical protein
MKTMQENDTCGAGFRDMPEGCCLRAEGVPPVPCADVLQHPHAIAQLPSSTEFDMATAQINPERSPPAAATSAYQ